MNFHLTTGDAQLIAYLIIVLTVLSLALVGAVIAFKINRDNLEKNSAAMQVRVLDAGESGDNTKLHAVALEILRGGVREQSDLTSVCNRTVGAKWWTPERIAEVQQSFIDAGLSDQLQRQLTSGSSIRRGLSVYIAGFPCWQVDPVVIEKFTQDKEPTVRLAAVGALERMATASAAEALIHALEQNHLPRARIIERLGHVWSVDSMLRAMDKPGQTWEIRCDLLRALSYAADARAIPVALAAGIGDNKFERMQAMRVLSATYALATTEQQQQIEEVAIKATHDDHANVRSTAVDVLRQIPHVAEFDQLEALVADADWFVRRGAARALLSLGEEGQRRLHRVAEGNDRFAAQRAREELAMLAAFPSYQQAGA
jgi:hypothetical protein